MMSKPRNIAYFPHMKVRGGRRRHNTRVQAAWRPFAEVMEGLPAVAQLASDAMAEIGRAAQVTLTSLGRWYSRIVFWNAWRRRRDHDEWVASHAITTGFSALNGDHR